MVVSSFKCNTELRNYIRNVELKKWTNRMWHRCGQPIGDNTRRYRFPWNNTTGEFWVVDTFQTHSMGWQDRGSFFPGLEEKWQLYGQKSRQQCMEQHAADHPRSPVPDVTRTLDHTSGSTQHGLGASSSMDLPPRLRGCCPSGKDLDPALSVANQSCREKWPGLRTSPYRHCPSERPPPPPPNRIMISLAWTCRFDFEETFNDVFNWIYVYRGTKVLFRHG